MKELSSIGNAIARSGLMLACGVTAMVAFLFLIYAAVYVDMANEQVVNLLTGLVTGVVSTMFNFYFGSSRGSDEKTRMMNEKMNGDK